MLEVCCGSFEDAMAAYEAGAERIELNSALSLGGLTPSLGSLILVKQYTDLEVMSMVRARGAGFCYTTYQYEQMLEDARLLAAYGTDGIVFGFLKEDRTIDKIRTKEFVQLIHDEGGKAVFHRAFDCVKDPYEAVETLIDLGVDRILTSGQQETAEEGISLLKDLQERYGRQIELLPGCGIRPENAVKIMKETGISQVHSSCQSLENDVTTAGEKVSYGYLDGEDESKYQIVSEEKVRQMLKVMTAFS
jgi:copper homeostasis protein